MEGEWEPNVEISPHCPRCSSSNTKFCYYNNYSLTQPRYFCKGCRRYWTKGGSLRNVPVGGGCRKTKRGKSIRSSNDRAISKNSAYGGSSNGPIPYSSHAGFNGNLSADQPTSSSSIDLALVYANFLNQQPPESKTRAEMQQFTSEISPSNNAFSDTILPHRSMDIHSSNNNNNEMYFCEMDSFQKQQEGVQIQEQNMTIQETNNINGLPPLPGEEVSSWLMSSQMMVPVHNPVQTTRFPGGIIEEEAQDLNQLVGDWIPFDLPSYDPFSTGLK